MPYGSIFIFLFWIEKRMKVETQTLLLSYIACSNGFSFFLYKRLQLGKTSNSWKKKAYFCKKTYFFIKNLPYGSIFIFLFWIEVRIKVETQAFFLAIWHVLILFHFFYISAWSWEKLQILICFFFTRIWSFSQLQALIQKKWNKIRACHIAKKNAWVSTFIRTSIQNKKNKNWTVWQLFYEKICFFAKICFFFQEFEVFPNFKRLYRKNEKPLEHAI